MHPAAATHTRSAAHIAIIAGCFFIKSHTSKNGVHCEYKNSCVKLHKVTVCALVSGDLRGYFPRKGGICSFLAALYRGIVLRDSGLERCMNASDDELYPNGEQEEPENAIDDFELFFSDASCNDVGVTHRVIDHVISSPIKNRRTPPPIRSAASVIPKSWRIQ